MSDGFKVPPASVRIHGRMAAETRHLRHRAKCGANVAVGDHVAKEKKRQLAIDRLWVG
jgi:hypothetical protein